MLRLFLVQMGCILTVVEADTCLKYWPVRTGVLGARTSDAGSWRWSYLTACQGPAFEPVVTLFLGLAVGVVFGPDVR